MQHAAQEEFSRIEAEEIASGALNLANANIIKRMKKISQGAFFCLTYQLGSGRLYPTQQWCGGNNRKGREMKEIGKINGFGLTSVTPGKIGLARIHPRGCVEGRDWQYRNLNTWGQCALHNAARRNLALRIAIRREDRWLRSF